MQALLAILTLFFTVTAAFGHGAYGVSSPGDALQPPSQPQMLFGKIAVTAGASANAAARTLEELKQILAEKINSGELSQAEANSILSRYGSVLVVYAQGASPKPKPTREPVSVISAAPVAQPTTAAETTAATTLPNSPPKPEASAASAVTVNVSAFNELSQVLNMRRRGARTIYAAGGSDSASGSSASFPTFGFGGANDDSGRAISDERIARQNFAPPTKVAVRGGGRTLASNSASASEGVTALSTGQRFRLLAGFSSIADDNGDPLDPPYPPWVNWFFGTVITSLCGRATWQWKRSRA